MYFGYFLVILGVLLLLKELGIIMGSFWGFMWPILLILFGLTILANKKDGNTCMMPWCRHHRHHHHDHDSKPDQTL